MAAIGSLLAGMAPAMAAGPSTGHSTAGSLHSGSGGTGISKSGGSGGTGLSSHGSGGRGHYHGVGAKSPTGVSSAASNTQQKMVPAKPFTPPPAGVRPQTDLAAATKSIALSSTNLVKRSQLFHKLAAPPGDRTLAGPVLNAIGPTAGGSASFKAVQGFSAAESNANIYPSNGRIVPAKQQSASLWSGASSTTLASSADADEMMARPRKSASREGWLLGWIINALTIIGVAVLGWWMWRQLPGGARMTMPATLVA